jgi:hypothetical protein
MKAISTMYKGYNFRSRLEARWAVYFDSIGLMWDYESEGYELENGSWYLPDFYIPEFGWIEIKHGKPSVEEIKKAKLLSKSNKCVAILTGAPDESKNEYICFSGGEEVCGIFFSEYSVRKWGQMPYWGPHTITKDDIININKAKSKRFEFGE